MSGNSILSGAAKDKVLVDFLREGYNLRGSQEDRGILFSRRIWFTGWLYDLLHWFWVRVASGIKGLPW